MIFSKKTNIYYLIKRFQHNIKTIKNYPNLDTKILKVAIVGTPNAGKSTIINTLMDRKVCPTSKKVHTTRYKSCAIFNEDNSQIVFLDTPGLVNDKERKKYKLEKNFLKDYTSSIKEADIIGVIHDISNVWTRDRIDIKIIKSLEKFPNKDSFLILNKIDLLKSKRMLLDLTRSLTDNCLNGEQIPSSKPIKKNDEIKGWPLFKEIFMVSALLNDGLDNIRDYLIKNAKPGEWLYPPETWSDQSIKDIIQNFVQAKLLDFLPQEIPYTLKSELEYLDIKEDGTMKIAVIINCSNERIAKLVAGESDGRLRQITESVQNDLENTFQKLVILKLIMNYPKKIK